MNNSLFQAPRAEARGTKTRGRHEKRGDWGERERKKEEEPVIIFSNTSCRPLLSKCVKLSKCQSEIAMGFFNTRASSRGCPARIVQISLSMSQTPPNKSSRLGFHPSKSCRFCQKNLTCLGTKFPRVSLFNTVRNKELIMQR